MPPAPTARLRFRAWRDGDGDLPLAHLLFGDPEVTALVGGPFDDAQIRARLAFELDNQHVHGCTYWPIETHAGAPVGTCGLKPRPEPRVLELGYYLAPAFWGGGYATEAARAVRDHAFAAYDIDALFAGHHPENHGSRRVLERVGFAYALHEHYPPTGLMHPCYRLPRP